MEIKPTPCPTHSIIQQTARIGGSFILRDQRWKINTPEVFDETLSYVYKQDDFPV